jgi:hypothetical protein
MLLVIQLKYLRSACCTIALKYWWRKKFFLIYCSKLNLIDTFTKFYQNIKEGPKEKFSISICALDLKARDKYFCYKILCLKLKRFNFSSLEIFFYKSSKSETLSKVWTKKKWRDERISKMFP